MKPLAPVRKTTAMVYLVAASSSGALQVALDLVGGILDLRVS